MNSHGNIVVHIFDAYLALVAEQLVLFILLHVFLDKSDFLAEKDEWAVDEEADEALWYSVEEEIFGHLEAGFFGEGCGEDVPGCDGDGYAEDDPAKFEMNWSVDPVDEADAVSARLVLNPSLLDRGISCEGHGGSEAHADHEENDGGVVKCLTVSKIGDLLLFVALATKRWISVLSLNNVLDVDLIFDPDIFEATDEHGSDD